MALIRPTAFLSLITALAAAGGLQAQAASGANKASIKDVRGRSVVVPVPAQRILIDDGRYLIALSLLSPDPVAHLAGWPRDINRVGERIWESFRSRYPRLEQVPQTSSSAGKFSLELTLSARPDVAVFTLGQGPNDAEVARMEKAGIAVVFIDFFSRPFENLEPSLRILGTISGHPERASEFLAFREQHLKAITSRIGPDTPRPLVFLEAHAGISPECCNSPGKGNVGDYITLVGGKNIGEDVLRTTFGKISLEYVLSRNPLIYIATGGPHLEASGGLTLGQGYTPQVARVALAKVASRRGINALAAVRSGNVHGLAHQLLNSPLDILAIEALARWIHPELFSSIRPEQTLVELNRRFLSVPLEGTYWTNLN